MKFPFEFIDVLSEDVKPGFYNIGNHAYHAGAGVSSSRLKKALVSYDAYHAPTGPSTALCFGRAFHAAILEPAEYREIPVISGGNRTKAYQEAVQAGRTVMCEDDVETIRGMSAAVLAHPEFHKLGAPDPEIMALSRCQDTGLLIKCKADLFGSAIVDFKSTSGGVTPGEFMHSVVNFGYHVSAAFYQDIIASLTGERLPFVIVPVTKTAPYECEFYAMSDALLEEGRKLYRAALKRIKKWESYAHPHDRIIAEKKIRTLNVTPRVIYDSQDTLRYLEETT